ncbi:hypothetical protein [Aerosakkonema funiforme]|uniref:Uncharacterized protein n=1 Tax=Aerosakkonema funiforme FACHB-1375 TaxID=2949571 RepID=A0A926VC41_9CYAN|nr:hypothetical protein [Aerosakkonema funiforme]MBD2181061.1 hypothetical protein [Aerosakkonema funiforme FACHB-1375]
MHRHNFAQNINLGLHTNCGKLKLVNWILAKCQAAEFLGQDGDAGLRKVFRVLPEIKSYGDALEWAINQGYR